MIHDPPEGSAQRCAEVLRMAMLVLGREEALDFINGECAELGGRPIDLVRDSDEGRDAVEAEIFRMALARG